MCHLDAAVLPVPRSLVCVPEHVVPKLEGLELVANGKVDQVCMEVPVCKQVGQLVFFWALRRYSELSRQFAFELLARHSHHTANIDT